MYTHRHSAKIWRLPYTYIQVIEDHDTIRTVRYDTARQGTTRHDTIQHDTARYDTTLYDTTRYGKIGLTATGYALKK